MNSRIEKLCLPRHRRDPLLKFWQPNAKLEKIHPINPWKSIHHNSVTRKQTIVNEKYSKLIETAPKNGCNYTTMIYRSDEGQSYQFYIDFEHLYLMHGSFKRLLIENEPLVEEKGRNQPSSVRLSSSHPPRLKNDQLQAIVLNHHRPSSTLHKKRFSLEKKSFIDSSMMISHRPRDLLNADLHPVHLSTESKKDSNIEHFFHRTYLIQRHLRLHALEDLTSIAEDNGFEINIIGHCLVYPKRLSEHEIETFGLVSDFGDLYEAHLIRVKHHGKQDEKRVLLLSSTSHASVKLASFNCVQSNNETLLNLTMSHNPESSLERIILNHVRHYLENKQEPLYKTVRRVRIELESLKHVDRRGVKIFLLNDDEIIDSLSLDVTVDQLPILFENGDNRNYQFLQDSNGAFLVHRLQKELRKQSQIFSSSDQFELDRSIMEEFLHAYASKTLTENDLQESVQLAIDYRFYDLLIQMESDTSQLNIDREYRSRSIQIILEEIQSRLQLQRERRIKAEETAQILLVGPPMDRCKNPTYLEKKTVILDNGHRTFWQKNYPENFEKGSTIEQQHPVHSIHQPVDNGPFSQDFISMAKDSFTHLQCYLSTKKNKTKLVHNEPFASTNSYKPSTKIMIPSMTRHRPDNANLTAMVNITNKSNNTSDGETRAASLIEFIPNRSKKFRRRKKRRPRSKAIRRQMKALTSKWLLSQDSKRVGKTLSTLARTKFLNKNTNSNAQQFKSQSEKPVKSTSSDSSDTSRTDQQADPEDYFTYVFGSKWSADKKASKIYLSKRSELLFTMDLSRIFIDCLHLHESVANEIASIIVTGRKKMSGDAINQLTNSQLVEGDDEDDTNPYVNTEIYFLGKEKNPLIMPKMTKYLMEVDWRIFFYLTEIFLRKGITITTHTLGFSSALFQDLTEESIYQTYFQANWCNQFESPFDDSVIEDFLRKIIDQVLSRIRAIHIPLLENLILINSLPSFPILDWVKELRLMLTSASPAGHRPHIWSSTELLLILIRSLSDWIWSHVNDHHLSIYIKMESLLVDYFDTMEIVTDLKNQCSKKRMNQNSQTGPSQYLLHMIDFDEAPKFFSDQAFQHFHLVDSNYNIDKFKDLILLDLPGRASSSQPKRTQIPLSLDGLIKYEKCRVIKPSASVFDQYRRSLNFRTGQQDEDNMLKHSGMPNVDRESDTKDEALNEAQKDRLIYHNTGYRFSLHLDDQILQRLEKAIQAVIEYDREHQIGDRKFKDRKIREDRFKHYVDHAGMDGVRIVNEALVWAKSRSNDANKIISIATNTLKKQFKQLETKGEYSSNSSHFIYTLETLLTTINDDSNLLDYHDVGQHSISDQRCQRNVMIASTETAPEKANRTKTQIVEEDASVSQIGITMGQLLALATAVHDQDTSRFSLTKHQIQQILNLHSELGNSLVDVPVPPKLELTAEQLIQISRQENISIADVQKVYTAGNDFHLDEVQLRHLSNQTKQNRESHRTSFVLSPSQLSTFSGNREMSSEQIDSSLNDSTQIDFKLSASQIAHLVLVNALDFDHLYRMEKIIQEESEPKEFFALNSSQLVYLLAQPSNESYSVSGLSASQLIALLVLQRQVAMKNPRSSFVLTHSQIKQLALQQGISIEVFQRLQPSNKPLVLTDEQWSQIVLENGTSLDEIGSTIYRDSTPTLDHKQLDYLRRQNNRDNLDNYLKQDEIRFYLNKKQIMSLSDETDVSTEISTLIDDQSNEIDRFRFKTSQLSFLKKFIASTTDMDRSVISAHNFTLSEEQFSSLLIPEDSIESSKPSLNEALTRVRERNQKSSVQQLERIASISRSIFARFQIDHLVHTIFQLISTSVHQLASESAKTLPAVIIDLLKMNLIDTKIFELIEQTSTTADYDDESQPWNGKQVKSMEMIEASQLTKAVIVAIQTHQLTLPQIQKIQTNFIPASLHESIQQDDLSISVLNVYKGHSPTKLLEELRSSFAAHDQGFEEDRKFIDISPKVPLTRHQYLTELSSHIEQQLTDLQKEYGLQPTQGNISVRMLFDQIQTTTVKKKIDSILGRSMDEVDLLNILHGHRNFLLSHISFDETSTQDSMKKNVQDRRERIERRIALLNDLKDDIEQNRLKRSLTDFEEMAFASEQINEFEKSTRINLTVTDLRILTMERFAPIERILDRKLDLSEYHRLLQWNTSLDFIEQGLLKRPLSNEERDQYQHSMFDSFSSTVKSSKEIYDQVLKQRAALVDQLELLEWLTPYVTSLEQELGRHFTPAEKKRMIADDYSIIQALRNDTTNLFSPRIESFDKNWRETETMDKKLIPTVDFFLSRENLQDKISLDKIDQLFTVSLLQDDSTVKNRMNSLSPVVRPTITEELVDQIKDNSFTKPNTSSVGPPIENRETTLNSSYFSNEIAAKFQSNEFTVDHLYPQAIRFNVEDVTFAIDRDLTSDEFNRLSSLRHIRVEEYLECNPTRETDVQLPCENRLRVGKQSYRIRSIENNGSYLMTIVEIEKFLDRALSDKELKKLSGQRFEPIEYVLKRPFDRNELYELLLNGNSESIMELMNNALDQQKEDELKQMPIERIQYFERILQRHFFDEELVRFANDRSMNPSLIQTQMTNTKTQPITRSQLQPYLMYNNYVEELEAIIGRSLRMGELQIIAGNRFAAMERRLGRHLNSIELRNLLIGKDCSSLAQISDLAQESAIEYEANQKRTKRIIDKLFSSIEPDSLYSKSSEIAKRVSSSSMVLPDEPFDHEIDRLEIVPTDVHPTENSTKSIRSSLSQEHRLKAFEATSRRVEYISDKHRIEQVITLNEAVQRLGDDSETNSSGMLIDRASEKEKEMKLTENMKSPLTSSLSQHSRESFMRGQSPVQNDFLLGWALFKGIESRNLGPKQERPRLVQVRHRARSLVVGIPEEYVDERSRELVNKIYRGHVSAPVLPTKESVLNTTKQFVSQLINLPFISEASHVIIPCRAYEDILESTPNYHSPLVDVDNRSAFKRDSPETAEWHEQCISRNNRIHAYIPLGYQPSIVYCHTGRHMNISPAKRDAQQQRRHLNDDDEKLSDVGLDTLNEFKNESFNTDSDKKTSGIVMDMIMQTISKTQKADLLEAIDDLFSQENLDEYQITDSDCQEIFLLLLNTYLRSTSINRKELFRKLTDQLNQLRKDDRHRSTYIRLPSIAKKNSKHSNSDDDHIDRTHTNHSDDQFRFETVIGNQSDDAFDYSLTTVTNFEKTETLPLNFNAKSQSNVRQHQTGPVFSNVCIKTNEKLPPILNKKTKKKK